MPKRNRDVDHPDMTVSSPIRSSISAVSFEGLSITTPVGEPATLGIVDQNGNVVEGAPEVARAVWNVTIRAYRSFLMAKGYLRVKTKPPDRD